MTGWRGVIGAVLLMVVGLPVAVPFVELFFHPAAWTVWSDADRLLLLARNTLLLVAGTLALVMPVGILAAFLLYRTDLPLRRGLRVAVLLSLFIPLPLFTSGWQAALGSDGWLSLTSWNTSSPSEGEGSVPDIAWKPWARGIAPAIWIHAVAGLPWVILIVGQGFRWVERELEEDALTAAPAWRVILHVTLRRSVAAIGAAALWVSLQTATEITVTDMMVVRTFAEEVYRQFVSPEPGSPIADPARELARAAAVSVPQILLTSLLVIGAVRRWERNLPPLETVTRPPREFPLGWMRWPWLLVLVVGVGLLGIIPGASLLWKAGVGGSPESWSVQRVGDALTKVLLSQPLLLPESLAAAAVGGVGAVMLALPACWLAIESRWFRYLVIGLGVAAWTVPGPLVGIGMKEVINWLVDPQGVVPRMVGSRGAQLVAQFLYDGPSILPVIWAYLVRFFPFAVALLWPVVRLIPVELRDAARVDGAAPLQEFRYVVWPLSAMACLRAALAVTVLALGELSASKLVATPGSHTFAHDVFIKMHYGITNDLAALCLLVLAAVMVGGTLVAIAFRRPSRTLPYLRR